SPSIPRSDLSLGASCHRRTADRPGPQRLIWCKDSGILRTTSTERRAAGGDRPRSGGFVKIRPQTNVDLPAACFHRQTCYYRVELRFEVFLETRDGEHRSLEVEWKPGKDLSL